MAFPFLPLLSALGGGLTAGAGSETTTDSSMVSDTSGTSSIDRSELSPEIIKALESMFGKNALNKNMNKTQQALSGQLKQVQRDANHPFDVNAFVGGIMKQANNTIDNQSEQSINLAESDIGGTQGNNSMAALLGTKIATDAAAQKAGIKADAVAKGTQIADQGKQLNTEATIGLTGAMNKGFTDFLTLLRGAQTNQTQSTSEHTEGTSTSTQSSPFDWMSGIGGLLSGFKMPT